MQSLQAYSRNRFEISLRPTRASRQSQFRDLCLLGFTKKLWTVTRFTRASCLCSSDLADKRRSYIHQASSDDDSRYCIFFGLSTVDTRLHQFDGTHLIWLDFQCKTLAWTDLLRWTEPSFSCIWIHSRLHSMVWSVASADISIACLGNTQDLRQQTNE